jgi:hypothetical protein
LRLRWEKLSQYDKPAKKVSAAAPVAKAAKKNDKTGDSVAKETVAKDALAKDALANDPVAKAA